jgi:hypothetical protein
MDAIAEIKKIYYAATKATILKDLDRAIDLLKTLPSEEERDRVAVYMDGLAQMRSEWKQAAAGGVSPSGSSRPASAQRRGGPPARSGRSTTSSRRTR